MPLRKETLERADGDRAIDVSTAAGGFTGVSTNSAADARQRVRIAGNFVRFFKPPVRNKRDVPARIGVGWTSHHAGKIGVQPIPVNSLVFEPFQHVAVPQFIRRLQVGAVRPRPAGCELEVSEDACHSAV